MVTTQELFRVKKESCKSLREEKSPNVQLNIPVKLPCYDLTTIEIEAYVVVSAFKRLQRLTLDGQYV